MRYKNYIEELDERVGNRPTVKEIVRLQEEIDEAHRDMPLLNREHVDIRVKVARTVLLVKFIAGSEEGTGCMTKAADAVRSDRREWELLKKKERLV